MTRNDRSPRYWTTARLPEDADVMGLLFDKPEPHMAEEDENMGDEAFVFINDLDESAYT